MFISEKLFSAYWASWMTSSEEVVQAVVSAVRPTDLDKNCSKFRASEELAYTVMALCWHHNSLFARTNLHWCKASKVLYSSHVHCWTNVSWLLACSHPQLFCGGTATSTLQWFWLLPMEIDQQMILAVYFAKSCFPVAYLKSRQLIVNILSLADGSAHQNRQNRKATTSGDLEPFSMVIHLSIFVTKSMSLKFEKQVELQGRVHFYKRLYDSSKPQLVKPL